MARTFSTPDCILFLNFIFYSSLTLPFFYLLISITDFLRTCHSYWYFQFLCSVFCNAVDKKDRDNNTQKALDVFDTFPKYGLKPDIVTYRGMIKMYILGKDIHSAIELKENMIKQVNDCEHDMITNDVQCMSFLSSTRHPYYYLYHIYCHCCCYYEEFGFLFSHLSFSLSCFNSAL